MRWVSAVCGAISPVWDNFNLFSYGEIFSQKQLPHINTLTSFGSAKTKIQDKLANLTGLSRVN